MGSVSEEQLLERLDEGKLVEVMDQMSPKYIEGMKRILTVSADTELIIELKPAVKPLIPSTPSPA